MSKASELAAKFRDAVFDHPDYGPVVSLGAMEAGEFTAAADLIESQAKALEEMRELLSTCASGWTEGSPMDEIWQKRRDKALASHSKDGEQG